MAAEPACRTARFEIMALRYMLPNGKSFFPVDRVRDHLTEDKIKEILRCRCDRCKAHRKYFNDDEPLRFVSSILGEPRAKGRSDNRKHSLFALLIYVEHPVLIMGFAAQNKNDWLLEVVTSWFIADNIKLCTGNYNANSPASFSLFVTEFITNLPQFSAPHMDNGDFIHYDDNVILPFVDEEQIGLKKSEQGRLTSEGANGKVFKFRIHKAYQKFPHANDVEWFARKKIEASEMQAYLEKAQLGFADDFKNPNIVRLIKAYRIGDSVNLIMPLARTNLAHLLREPTLQYGEKRGGPLESCDAWVQFLGIAKALRQIGGLEGRDSDRARLCIHFDLKPENILVDVHGNWVITDFGQAALAYSNGRTPRVMNHFGTDAYAPPEIDNPAVPCGRKYDVWSMGCILLEVASFVVAGYPGLIGSSPPDEPFDGLDLVRKARPPWGGRRSDERFFYRETSQGEPVIKKEICDFMDSLDQKVANVAHGGEKSKTFFETILHLISEMLKPKVDERMDISEVVRVLSAAIDQATAREILQIGAPVEPADDESRIGGSQLSSLSVWHKPGGAKEWDPTSLEAFESDGGNMRLLCPPQAINFPRANVKILPLYAFWPQDYSRAPGPWIQFSFLTYGPVSRVADAEFSFSSMAGYSALDAARIVQSKLTSQNIEGSFALDSVELKRFVPVPSKILNKGLCLLGYSKAAEEAEDYIETLDLGSTTLQLWVEKVDEAAEKRRRRLTNSSHGSHSSRPSRSEHSYQSGYRELPPRRVVMYLHESGFICTIKMDVNWVLQVDEDDKTECVLFFQPNQPHRDPHFVASWIRPTIEEKVSEIPAGVPLSPAVLHYFEDRDRFEADRFKLKFNSPGARIEFQRKYRAIKKEWDDERLELENTLGYQPVNRRPDHMPHPDLIDSVTIPMPKHKARFSLSEPSRRSVDPPQSPEPVINESARPDNGKGRAVDLPEEERLPKLNGLLRAPTDKWKPILPSGARTKQRPAHQHHYPHHPHPPELPKNTAEHPQPGKVILRGGRGPKRVTQKSGNPPFEANGSHC